MAAVLTRGVVLYIAGVNLTSISLFAYDKHQAENNGWRVSEKRLCNTALAGGWLGGLFAMQIFRHKTRKRSFQKKYVSALASNVLVTGPMLLITCFSPVLRHHVSSACRSFFTLPGKQPPRRPPRWRR